jgi:hypothetical protein
MKAVFLASLIILACCRAAPSVAGTLPAPQRIECPGELPDDAFRIGKPTNGWIPYKYMPLRLHSAAPTAGPPEEHADLAEFSTVKTKHSRIDTYPLPLPHPGGIWMKCGYGSLNEITLHRRLDDRIRECRITTSNGELTVIDIVCQ